MQKNLRRSVVALAATLTCLAVMASPTSATTSVHPVTITGGTITSYSAGTFPTVHTDTLGGMTHTGCSTSSAVTVDDAANTISITGLTSVGTFILGTTHYVATITRTASNTVAYGGGAFNSVTVTLNVLIKRAVVQTSTLSDCAAEGSNLCTLRATLHFSGTYSGGAPSTGATSFSSNSAGTFPPPSGGATITLGIGTCQVPFSTFNGGQTFITGLTGTF